MTRVLIVIDDDAILESAANRADLALRQSIGPSVEVSIQAMTPLQQQVTASQIHLGDWLLCPLTLNLPTDWPFLHQGIYQTCRDVAGLRQQVNLRWQVPTGEGAYWLPIVQTAKGTLYAEAIASVTSPDPSLVPAYQQPFHLEDAQRQPLYALGQKLMQHLAAPPAVYLMQFGLLPSDPTGGQTSGIIFDRLFPFPAAPAIASVGIQTPDLFACHWACLNQLPILDLTIRPPVQVRFSPSKTI